MSKPLIFLDIDGVLNGGQHYASFSATIHPPCVEQLRRILQVTDADVVLSSSWRYVIFIEIMTLQGFQYLLRSHGLNDIRLIDTTQPDEWCQNKDCGNKDVQAGQRTDADCNTICRQCETPVLRGMQIRGYLRRNPRWHKYVVLDDDNDGMTDFGLKFVQTDGRVGLTAEDADKAISILKGTAGEAE